MKVFAQHGHQQSDKVKRGLSEPNLLDGVIFSSRYLNPDRVVDRFTEVLLANPEADILVDPEFYASWLKGTPNCQLGFLEKRAYFKSYRRRDLVRAEVVNKVLNEYYETVADLGVTAHIAPNIYISQSFDSIEAGIALNFIEKTKEAFEKSKKPVYATLAIDRRTLLSSTDFLSFLNDLTGLPNPPDGFYVIVGGGPLTERSDFAQSEIFDAAVIGGWMMVNYSLSQNGFSVVNGFTDILTPFLATAGATGCATGWWSNLRTFSMGRYVKPESSGGQLPVVRYLSKGLLNRIRIEERAAFSSIVPEIINRLPSDKDYDSGIPDRTIEALQTWETLSSLNREIVQKNLEQSLSNLTKLIAQASVAYATFSRYGITGGYETNTEYLDQLRGGTEVFKKLAELE